MGAFQDFHAARHCTYERLENSMGDEVLVKVEGVSKKFCRSLKRSLWYGVQDVLGEIAHRKGDRDLLRNQEFWAVNDINMEVRKGTCVGLIGPNGSGKTTLLRMLGGLLKPDAGRIISKGRVMALINLGAGFNPVLTGRENIYINSSVLGARKRETDALIDQILEFSGIEDAIDSPVMTYSSGMKVRLGFAVAAHMNPDVLLLDEVLAVGDAEFRDRCYRRIGQIRKESAVIFVSHNMEQIDRICDQAIVMQKGKSIFSGQTSDAITTYEEILRARGDHEDGFLSIQEPIRQFNIRLDAEHINCGNTIRISTQVDSESELDNFTFRIIIYNSSGGFAGDCNLTSKTHGIRLQAGLNEWILDIQSLALRNGKYKFGFSLIDKWGDQLVWSYKKQAIEVFEGHTAALSDYQLTVINVASNGSE